MTNQQRPLKLSEARFLGFIEGDQLVILTNGFKKKTQKTPRREIELAETRKREHQGREVINNG